MSASLAAWPIIDFRSKKFEEDGNGSEGTSDSRRRRVELFVRPPRLKNKHDARVQIGAALRSLKFSYLKLVYSGLIMWWF